ncbi:hypothetical protein [Tropicimonas sp. IMCC6043]|uniref:hypothetical protein n=1 Tax=Tropicimonas sp. IMCC6043 TaxID=2510645 RepID=UPI0013ECF82B|nr:hypothetical protein [Tropicimonas sp. IMCC6043]
MARNLALTASSLAIALALVPSAEAAILDLEFDFTGGFDLSVNGDAAVPSGRIIFNVIVDDTTPDLEAAANVGRFATQSISVTAASLGIFGATVLLPSEIFLSAFEYSGAGGVGFFAEGYDPDTGWNGGPAPGSFMSDINDLSTLSPGTEVAMASTFLYGTFTLEDGTTLYGETYNNGPDGLFSVHGEVPLPTSVAFLFGGLCVLGGMARRKVA